MSFDGLIQKLDQLDDNLKAAFIRDFQNAGEEALNALVNAENKAIDSWKTIKYCGDDQLAQLANNADELELVSNKLDDIASEGGYKAWKLAETGDNLLTAEGKFIDNVLEGDYQRYITRKTAQGKLAEAKDRINWKKAVDYWNNDSWIFR